jgi:transcription elongation factor
MNEICRSRDARRAECSNGGPGEAVVVPEDGGARRDLRAEVDMGDADAQLTARLPPPSVLALERTVTGRDL